jgi:hypothetical protein
MPSDTMMQATNQNVTPVSRMTLGHRTEKSRQRSHCSFRGTQSRLFWRRGIFCVSQCGHITNRNHCMWMLERNARQQSRNLRVSQQRPNSDAVQIQLRMRRAHRGGDAPSKIGQRTVMQRIVCLKNEQASAAHVVPTQVICAGLDASLASSILCRLDDWTFGRLDGRSDSAFARFDAARARMLACIDTCILQQSDGRSHRPSTLAQIPPSFASMTFALCGSDGFDHRALQCDGCC